MSGTDLNISISSICARRIFAVWASDPLRAATTHKNRSSGIIHDCVCFKRILWSSSNSTASAAWCFFLSSLLLTVLFSTSTLCGGTARSAVAVVSETGEDASIAERMRRSLSMKSSRILGCPNLPKHPWSQSARIGSASPCCGFATLLLTPLVRRWFSTSDSSLGMIECCN